MGHSLDGRNRKQKNDVHNDLPRRNSKKAFESIASDLCSKLRRTDTKVLTYDVKKHGHIFIFQIVSCLFQLNRQNYKDLSSIFPRMSMFWEAILRIACARKTENLESTVFHLDYQNVLPEMFLEEHCVQTQITQNLDQQEPLSFQDTG